MSLAVNYKLTLGAQSYSADARSQLLSLQTSASLAVPVNQCLITLASGADVRVQLGDPVIVELGYGSKLLPVFKGQVSHIERGLTRLTLEASSAMAALTQTYLNRLYDKPQAGDIVKDVVKQAGLKAGRIDSGLSFAVYTLGDLQSAYGHLQHLARQCGVDLYANVDDKVMFAAYKAAKVHDGEYGNNLLRCDLIQSIPGVDQIEVYGESPASKGQGDKATTWLTQKEIKGLSGKGGGVTLRLADPTARTEALAKKIAQAMLATHQAKARGRLTLLGDGAIALGDGIRLSKLPQAEQNGTFKIVGVSQRLGQRTGFTTVVDWETES